MKSLTHCLSLLFESSLSHWKRLEDVLGQAIPLQRGIGNNHNSTTAHRKVPELAVLNFLVILKEGHPTFILHGPANSMACPVLSLSGGAGKAATLLDLPA